MVRLALRLQLFAQDQLLVFQVGDLLLVRRDHRRVVRLDDALQHPVGLLGEVAQQIFHVRLRRLALRKPLLPGILEHGAGERHHALARLQPGDDLRELVLELVARNRFAGADTVAVVAEIVRMLLAGAAPGPARGERLAAVTTLDEAAQRKVDADLLLDRRPGSLIEARLNPLIGLDRDQGFMVTLAARDVPLRGLDAAGIDRTREKVGDALEADRSIREVLGVCGLAFEEPLHLALRLETADSKPLEGFLDGRGKRLVAHQHVAVTRDALVAVAERGRETPVPVHGASPHAIDGLLAVLLALMLRDAGEKVLDQDGIRVLAELDRRAFQDSAGSPDGRAQLQMRIDTARKPGDVVDDDDDQLLAILAMLAQVREHPLHAGTRGEASGHVVLEDLDDIQSLVASVFAAAGFLRAKAVTARRLLGARDPAIDDSL